jgi:hypothetical protein
VLVFVHIPKTAGTTLHKIISHQYAPKRVLIRHDTDGLPDAALLSTLNGETAATPQVIMGHLSVGLHHHVPRARYITCLREPVSRLVSHYHHALSDPAHYLHQDVVSRKLDLADYVSSGLSGELANGMTRMLAGVADFHHATVTEQTLALAKSNIETLFDGVILSESFDRGILLLAETLNWKTPYYLRRKVGHYDQAARKPDEPARKVIEEHNRFDCELHAWAKNRFETQATAIPGLAARTTHFQKSNRSLGKAIFCFRELKLRLCASIPFKN